MSNKDSIVKKMTLACRKTLDMIQSGKSMADCQRYLISQVGFGFPRISREEFKAICLAYVKIGERNGY